MPSWTIADIPPQSGKLAVITGATGGLGYETALALAAAGAEVVLTGRNPGRGADALARIHARHPRARISYEQLDLASLAGVAAFSQAFAAAHDRLDLLVNNAGVMALPTRRQTEDGFELQFGTNYLSHFALTAELLPLLRKAPQPRVVSLSSGVANMGRIDFDDLQARAGYRPWTAYSQSKLAMLMFAFELQRRSDRAGWGLMSMAAHPGFARTDLIEKGPGRGGISGALTSMIEPLISQSAAEGALPQLYAATSPDAVAGGYYGPSLLGMKGPPKVAASPGRARDAAAAARLWSISETLTGQPFPTLAQAAE